MKTVGIITTFRQPNWGSVLQAFALYRAIESCGYRAKLIDYVYPNDYHYDAGYPYGSKHKSFKQKIKTFLMPLLVKLGIRRRDKMYLLNQFISEEIPCTKRYKSRSALQNCPPIFDIYVSGSDQIWNPNTMYGDMSYMFDFVQGHAKKIAYSSSFSCDRIPAEYKKKYSLFLSGYSAVGVREKNGVILFNSVTGRTDAKVVLDPTLLLCNEEWRNMAQKSRTLQTPKKYILFYMLAYTYQPEEKMAELLMFTQKKYGLPIVSLSKKPNSFNGDFTRIEETQEVGVYEFLKLFASADIVVTSSFHGTAFSINMGIPFFSLVDGKSMSDDRIQTLIDKVGLETQLITTETKLIESITPYYDMDMVREKLDALRNYSFRFLKNSLN